MAATFIASGRQRTRCRARREAHNCAGRKANGMRPRQRLHAPRARSELISLDQTTRCAVTARGFGHPQFQPGTRRPCKPSGCEGSLGPKQCPSGRFVSVCQLTHNAAVLEYPTGFPSFTRAGRVRAPRRKRKVCSGTPRVAVPRKAASWTATSRATGHCSPAIVESSFG